MWEYVVERSDQILFLSYQHASLVIQCVALATVIAMLVAVVVYRNERFASVANSVSAVGLTIPSFALLGMLVAPFGFGVLSAVIAVTFYAALPILRNAVVGLAGVDARHVEAARAIGMSRLGALVRVELPLAWPVILAGIRVSTQMVMGIAAIAAYVLGPGLGGFIFSGLARLGGANAVYSALTGTIAVVVIALVVDLLLVLVGRLTIPRGIRA
ncbi:ABC transporter permease [Georgenia thermotolerans]|uniref:ABC transporter permease subunit n=1 Tax=Georgenia thermotolerans TaxID=527326 RepID=A0A7J5UTM9_9MICO|nr:ABC transporter permease [Georgenia thermotolerans]KAE8765628.1 ABC transporter permease subunit [Georgenia thermotolerans]